MKKIHLILLAFSFATFSGCSSDSTESTTTKDSATAAPVTSALTSVATTANDETALKEIKKEPKVKDAVINEAGVLYASVEDDGTSRDGYASYLCQVLADNHSKVSKVKIIKFGSSEDKDKDNVYGIIIGEADCK